MINKNSENIKIEGYVKTWYVVDHRVYNGKTYYLLENEWYGDVANYLIVDHNGNVICDDEYDLDGLCDLVK